MAYILLKHMYQLSDGRVGETWLENPYYQYFCGKEYFQHHFPIQRSTLLISRPFSLLITKKAIAKKNNGSTGGKGTIDI